MTPEDVRVEPSLGFLAATMRGHRRVLEVGCGGSTVARRLGAMGFEATALDRELRDPTPAPGVAFVEHDFLDYAAAPFDAIAFTASLHHIEPLGSSPRGADRRTTCRLLLTRCTPLRGRGSPVR